MFAVAKTPIRAGSCGMEGGIEPRRALGGATHEVSCAPEKARIGLERHGHREIDGAALARRLDQQIAETTTRAEGLCNIEAKKERLAKIAGHLTLSLRPKRDMRVRWAQDRRDREL